MTCHQSTFDVVTERLTNTFGPRQRPDPRMPVPEECKAYGWDLSRTGFCVLRAAKGTVILPWLPEIYGRCYLVTRIRLPRTSQKGRSTSIASACSFLGWKQIIAYLDLWTTFDLDQLISLIRLQDAGQSVPVMNPPLFEYPSINGRSVSMTSVHRAVIFRDGGRCVLCGSREALQFDHLIPQALGGASSYANLRLLCMKCNLQKSNRV